ncbi:MAG: Multi-sensor hybrid histidine kinase [Candidatus Azambacteria bacterium GW2011_GWB1_46_27]|uniref:Multi-sensor hybrid histidine kinase n=1 Tax=Candidatus Azambacteria bacterium GW2011_GWB1_46_27 TaxID=1618617 RepID=A0A0G1PIP0_9BACT|nr:MAG: Multi-sensor hybrid histidine kinase [Candidatus Azambacteria bacterium GW2011_GWB1_46_27]
MFANVINWFVNFLSEPGRRRWWIRLLLFFLIVFPLALFVVFQYRTFYQESTDVEISRKDTTAQLAAMLLHEKFDHLTDVGVSLAARIRFRELIAEGKWNEALLFLKGVLTDFPFFERVTLADPNGTITADIVEPSDVIGKNFAFRDWYQGVSKEWKPYISDIFKSAAAPYYNNVILAVPIKDENQKTKFLSAGARI